MSWLVVECSGRTPLSWPDHSRSGPLPLASGPARCIERLAEADIGHIADRRRIVGAGDRDRHRVGGRRAGAVGRRQRVGQRDRLASLQEVQIGVVDRVAPGRAARRCRVGHAGREAALKQRLQRRIDRAAAPHRPRGQRRADVDHVVGVDVVEADRAARAQRPARWHPRPR